MRTRFERLNDAELRAAAASKTQDLADWIALSAIAAARILEQEMYESSSWVRWRSRAA